LRANFVAYALVRAASALLPTPGRWLLHMGRASRRVSTRHARVRTPQGLGKICVLALLLTTGCRQDMHDQPRYKPLARSSFFEDGRASRPLVAGTIARGHLHEDTRLYTGKEGDDPITKFPFPVTTALLERGQQRFNIYCSPCHDRAGTGLGMVVRRGLRRPPSYHIDRLRAAPVGYFFDVITNGFGAMPDYAAQIEPQDRWAIVAYIRVLQRSQNAKLADVPPDKRAALGSPR
jgi:Cytochrome C oxidase, cbb3-type, subunit III